MTNNNIDISNIPFAIASITAGIIAVKCSTAPNPKPAHAEKNDILFKPILLPISIHNSVFFTKWIFLITGFLAAILSLDLSKSVCPNYSNLDNNYIKPSVFSIACLVVAIGFGLLRLEAYRELGRDFTFHLAKPEGLVMEGLYAWMQHPSYTGMLGFMAAIFVLWLQPKGVLGCFIPGGLADMEWLWWCWRLWFWVVVGFVTRGRVLQEEEMMKREFGREWEVYHSRVARFIPGVF